MDARAREQFSRARAVTITETRAPAAAARGMATNQDVQHMDKEKIKNIWKAVKTIIEVIIGFLCGTQIDSWLGGPLL